MFSQESEAFLHSFKILFFVRLSFLKLRVPDAKLENCEELGKKEEVEFRNWESLEPRSLVVPKRVVWEGWL